MSNIIMNIAMFQRYTLDLLNIGRMDMAIQLGLIKSKISQREAFKRYGKVRVETWEKRKLITSVKEKGATSTRYYSIIELEVLDRSDKY